MRDQIVVTTYTDGIVEYRRNGPFANIRRFYNASDIALVEFMSLDFGYLEGRPVSVLFRTGDPSMRITDEELREGK